MRKSAEGRVPPLMKKYFIYPHKKTDFIPGVGKNENGTDYLLSVVPINLEVKQTGADGRFLTEWFTEQEIKAMNKYGGWIFMEFGNKPAPKGKVCYLITWDIWLEVYKSLEERGIKSITKDRSVRGHPGAVDLFSQEYALVWSKEDHNWDIPAGHPFWKFISEKLDKAARYYESIAGGRYNDSTKVDS